ncbi:MAG: hypothetical protein CSB23_01870 [Deltaproteobacteria bacterium]|nr:MAG: hypothetical protein CSB23_01870 [Deltaproteobacteria bacterium]
MFKKNRRLPLKNLTKTTLFLVCLSFLVSCGYRNPNVYNGPAKAIYLTEWKNRTSQLGLDSEIYQSLTNWFQKSGALSTTRQRNGADLILAGEIVSLALPSLSYNDKNKAQEAKVKLTIRYILKDMKSNKVLLEVPLEVWTEAYSVTGSAATDAENEAKALEKIIDDLSLKIYQRTVAALPR